MASYIQVGLPPILPPPRICESTLCLSNAPEGRGENCYWMLPDSKILQIQDFLTFHQVFPCTKNGDPPLSRE